MILLQNQLSKLQMVANKLAQPNNTITTLEIKLELRKQFPNEAWYQQDISDTMRELSDEQQLFDYYDNGTFRTYTLLGVPNKNAPQLQSPSVVQKQIATTPVKVKKVRANQTFTVDRAKVLDLIEKSNGTFFSIKPHGNGTVCRLKAFDTPKGYLTVLDINNGAKDLVINVQSLTEVKIGGNNYIIQ
jgi:hypothetical protein